MAIDFSGVARSAAGTVGSAVQKAAGSVFDLLDPANARRAISGLLPGGDSSAGKSSPNIGFGSVTGQGAASGVSEDDWRVRISLANNSTIFYKDSGLLYNSLLAPLKETNGVVWPYTPTIAISHTANYSSSSLTHSNYAAYFYNNSEVNEISITGDFTVQSIDEGKYLMATVYFLRACTKMFFGQGNDVGNPPPIVFLDGYGSHYFPHVPCVVTTFTHNLPDNVDYIKIPITNTTLEDVLLDTQDPTFGGSIGSVDNRGLVISPLLQSPSVDPTTPKLLVTPRTTQQFKTIETNTRVPTSSSITVTLRPVYSRNNLANRFDLRKFANGDLLQDKKNGFGGFL